MSLSGGRVYAGFGLGAIQTGLFLYEAGQSGHFGRLVAAEVLPEVVRSVRENGGFLAVNIAQQDGVETATVGPVEVYNPAVEADRARLVEALAEANEIGTAVPGVNFYTSQGAGSLDRVLADGLARKAERGGPRAVIYAAENHNRAAEILAERVAAHIPASEWAGISSRVRFLNTVIGKMSGVIAGPAEIQSLGLASMTPNSPRAFLVEAFNRILISRVDFEEEAAFPAFQRGLDMLIEKDDLLPFEEAKLYGHNATHALAAYLGGLLGVRRIADLPAVPGAMDFLRRAFLEESGAALIQRYRGLDPLFTPAGYAGYADDLLARMVNPWLADTVERVGRDPARKLGWDDRLVGTLRLGLAEGVAMRRYALSTGAALTALDPQVLTDPSGLGARLRVLWGDAPRDLAEEQAVMLMVAVALNRIRRWHCSCKDDPVGLLVDM